MKIGFALTSSYCTLNLAIEQIDALVKLGYDVIPIVSPNIIKIDTRFSKADEIKEKLEFITGNKIVSDIIEAEKFGATEPLDLLVIAPLTGNTLAKLALGMSDTPVTLAAKATRRNEKPVVLGVSTNDLLGNNFVNFAQLKKTEGYYIVPFSQDDPINKVNSGICHFDEIIPTISDALIGKQRALQLGYIPKIN